MMKRRWETISSRIVHRTPWFDLVVDKIMRSGEWPGKYTYVDKLPGAIIFAFTGKGEFYLVGQWRYPIKKYSWEIPMGTAEPGETILTAAKRELAEEIGVQAQEWKKIGIFYFASGLTNQIAHVYTARSLSPIQVKGDDTEELALKKVTPVHFERMVKENKIFDAPSIAAYWQVKLHLGI